MGSPEEEIEKEIKKAQAWYGGKYRKKFTVAKRYDKVTKHFSWRIIADIGGKDRILPFGISVETMESEKFPIIKARILDYIKQSLIKAQVKWEPMILSS